MYKCEQCDKEEIEYAQIEDEDDAIEHESEFHGQRLTQNGLDGNYMEVKG